MVGTKQRVRAIALQALYEAIVLKEPAEEALARAVKTHEASPNAATQARQLIHAVGERWHHAAAGGEALTEETAEDEAGRLCWALVRHIGRILALQTLYETDIAAHKPHAILAYLQEEYAPPPEAVEFARSLVTGVLTHQTQIDTVLAKAAPAWPLDQIAAVDRNILRLAIYEILLDNKTPVRAAINEAVELAKTFGSDNSAKFVNGVLGSVSLTAAQHQQT